MSKLTALVLMAVSMAACSGGDKGGAAQAIDDCAVRVNVHEASDVKEPFFETEHKRVCSPAKDVPITSCEPLAEIHRITVIPSNFQEMRAYGLMLERMNAQGKTEIVIYLPELVADWNPAVSLERRNEQL